MESYIPISTIAFPVTSQLPDTESLRLVLEEGVAENTRDARGRTAMHLVASRAEVRGGDG